MSLHVRALVCLGLAAFVLRLMYFTGLSLGDDVFYALQALEHATHHAWPPAPYHWQTRVGITVPTSVFLAVFGLKPFAFVLWPLLASTAAVFVCYFIALEFVPPGVAWTATVFQACFPMELIYATHLFPDLLVGLFASLSIWCWIRGLRRGMSRDFFLAGLFFAAGYLCRETVILLGPVYLALWLLEWRRTRPELLWVAVMPVLTIGLEVAVYWLTTGSAMYRWQAIAAQQHATGNLHVIASSTAGGGFWLDPILMVAFNQEFAAYQIIALPVALYALVRWPVLRPLAMWWVVGFVWFYYGTTVPDRYVPLMRDPRYAAPFTIPGVILVASAVSRVISPLRYLMIATLLALGLAAASVDLRSSPLEAHERLIRSPLAADVSLEPFEYFGARWKLGLANNPTFTCLDDQGRASVVNALVTLDHTRTSSTTTAKYVVFSPERRPDLSPEFAAAGWKLETTFQADLPWSRRLIAQVLSRVPGQADRAAGILRPSKLVVLRNPGLASGQ